MKTLLIIGLKVFAVVVLGLLMFHFWPVTAVPFIVALVLALVLGALILAGVMAVGAATLGAIVGLLSVAVVFLALLSPVWAPLAVVFGIIWLCRRPGARKPQAPSPA